MQAELDNLLRDLDNVERRLSEHIEAITTIADGIAAIDPEAVTLEIFMRLQTRVVGTLQLCINAAESQLRFIAADREAHKSLASLIQTLQRNQQ